MNRDAGPAAEITSTRGSRSQPTRAWGEMGFTLRRLGVVAAPEPGNPAEEWGILNPGAARGRDGQLYLFPQVVAEGNYSRIAIPRVCFDVAGIPTGIERLGYALEPTEPYEKNAKSGGGCEDARVTYPPYGC